MLRNYANEFANTPYLLNADRQQASSSTWPAAKQTDDPDGDVMRTDSQKKSGRFGSLQELTELTVQRGVPAQLAPLYMSTRGAEGL